MIGSYFVVQYFVSFQVLLRKRELFALLSLSSWCLVAVSVLWLFLMVPWPGCSAVCDCGISWSYSLTFLV